MELASGRMGRKDKYLNTNEEQSDRQRHKTITE
jgi:hypothetical protein